MPRHAIITVGEGRGFLMDAGPRLERIVITAAHCLPHLPPPMTVSSAEDRMYTDFLGPIGGARSIWAECLFVDPVADIAVLGKPAHDDLIEESENYTAFVEGLDPLLTLGHVTFVPWFEITTQKPIAGSVLSLDGEWIACDVYRNERYLWLRNVDIRGGMSGSPIVVDGGAVGVIGLGCDAPQASLAMHLPVWIVRALTEPPRDDE
jgi:hypothetical protein